MKSANGLVVIYNHEEQGRGEQKNNPPPKGEKK